MRHRTPPAPSGFTIIELLVAISIMVTIIAIIFPVVSILTKSNRLEAGVDTVQVAVTAIRAYATRPQQKFEWSTVTTDKAKQNAALNHAYGGTAILFAPSGEARLVQNVLGVADSANGNATFEQLIANNGTVSHYPRNAYDDIPQRDYIRLPSGSGVLGIVSNTGSSLGLITPPFALRFNAYGQMIYGNASDESTWVYYPGKCNATIASNSDRKSVTNYDPTTFTPQLLNGALAAKGLRYTLPFEKIETVVGVLVYSKVEFAAAGSTVSLKASGANGQLDNPTTDWLKAHGRTLFFSRYTGAVIR